ncbi:TPA: RHS repeat-associated core domain-containing protein [Vibrio parahaemolyticus]|nr:RHS repeat-associated core domain-containing protein [Vibrio parahaemolyticus]
MNSAGVGHFNASSQKVWKASYSPFGKASITSQGLAFNLRFPGQYFDAETGLHYNWRRYYDPNTGRYITSDPLGLFDGVNTYGYVHGNPMSNTDPTGEFAWGVVLGAANFAWQMYQNDGDIDCVNWGDVASWSLGGLGAGIGAKIGLKLAGNKGLNKQFSHFIPSRYVRKGSKYRKPWLDNKVGRWLVNGHNKWNGNYVHVKRHFKHDPFAFGNKAFPGKTLGQKWNPLISVLDRVPYTWKGTVTGAAAGAGAGEVLGSNGGCNCGN